MVNISTDSTCDLPQSIFEAYNIGLLPLTINCGDKSYKDGVDMSPDDVYKYVERDNLMCTTAAINTFEYEEHFKNALQGYDAVVHFCISADMSACYQNALLASEQFENVYVIDARNLSSGIGLLVFEAAEMAKAGKSASEILARIQEITNKVDASFVVETMDYLKRGGRCTALQAFGAAVLKIKPCIAVIDGKMTVATTYRGSMERCMKAYVKERLENQQVDTRRIFITHSGVTDETVALVKEEISKYQQFDEVYVNRASCTISCHCGPGTLGILFIRK